MDSKKFYLSKTFWINILAIVALIIQTQTGFVFSPEAQVSVLALLNIVLRAVTKAPIEWK